jgi:hypothetical protein
MGLIRSFFDLLYEVLNLILSLSKHSLSNLPESLGKFSERTCNRSARIGKDLSEFWLCRNPISMMGSHNEY